MFTDDPYGADFLRLEGVPGSFIQAFQNKMDNEYPNVTYKAVSVHNFPNLYNPNGYKAVGIFSAPTFFNAIQAEYSWFPFGEYNRSVGDGKEETVGYIKDQISLCPNQQLVLGGYSQGAQVMGESVFMLSTDQRQKIAALALFGDPKYIGSDISSSSSSLNWFDVGLSIFSRPKAKPWKRGSAGLNDRGLADARIPYVPADMENKTLSWCFNDDFVCSGGSGIFQTIISGIQAGVTPSIKDYSNGHTRYATFGAPQAAREVVQRLAPSIGSLDIERGGIDPGGTHSQSIPVRPNNKPIDIMLMLNTSAGVDDVLGQMRFNTIEVLQPMYAYFSEALYGVGEYSETGSLPNRRVPRVAIHQNPTRVLDTLNTKMYRPLAFGGQSGGGLDPPDPHQIAIERAVMSTNWREEAEKHVVLITNRMPHDSYTYNICNSDVRTGFGITTPNNCNTNPSLETDFAKLHPERCKNIYGVLTKTNCTVEMTDPFHTYNIVRKTEDAINLALARGVIVDVVVPSTVVGFFDSATGTNYTAPAITAALKKIADSTGGAFLQYDSFTKANYTDMYWRILNHKSRVIPLSAIGNYDKAGSVDGLASFAPMTVETKKPILFDTGGLNVFDQYKWDFDGDGVWDETTDSPSTDFVFDSAAGEVLAVVAGFNNGIEQSRSVLPLNVTAGEETDSLTTPELPAGLEAVRDGDNIVIAWQVVNDEAVLFIGDPTSGLPISSTPLSAGSLVIDSPDPVIELLVWVDSATASSTRAMLEVKSSGPTVQEGSTKVLVESESDPNSQFIGQQGNDEPLVQGDDSNNAPNSQQTVQQAETLTEVRAEQTQGEVLQQASDSSDKEPTNGINEPDPDKNSDSILYIIIGSVFVLLVAGGTHKFINSKD